MGVSADAGGLRMWRALAGALAIIALTGATVAIATAGNEPPSLGAAADAKPLPDLLPPVLAGDMTPEPGRVTATDWVSVTYPEPDPPPAVRTARPGSGSGSSGGAWYVVCGPGSAALDPAPPCGFDEDGQPIVGERVWIDS